MLMEVQKMSFESLSSIVSFCEYSNKPFWEIVCDAEQKQSGLSQKEEINKMNTMWQAMISTVNSYDAKLHSASGLSGGDGDKYFQYSNTCNTICGDYIGQVITCALQTAESNACMKRIVAAPTAGSCGVLPAVLIPLFHSARFSEDMIIKNLFVAAGIGQVIANRASISGAEGGCQAEIGAASAMAAGTLVSLYGGDAHKIEYAVGFALQNLLGLVCDPVAGLVEIPCIKRNVIGALNACSCADMALASITPKIPADEVIDAMKQIGNKMDSSLKETGQGGLAATPTAHAYFQSRS
jgi:L-serine dehydratase